MRITARVPATSANLGAGFDCLALALQLFNEVTIEPGSSGITTIHGEGSQFFPRDESNLVHRAVAAYFHRIGGELPPMELTITNRIPLNGGLGSSAAAVIGGLLVAREIAPTRLDDQELIELAYKMEGHPDNVAAALLGGLTVSVVDEGRLVAVKLPFPPGIKAVLFLPGFRIPTVAARRILPRRVPREDAVYNLSRAAFFLAALQADRWDLLRLATKDRLHQPYRTQLFPAMPRFLERALAAGALGACLSGAGSTILALAKDTPEAVATALERAGEESGVAGRAIIVDICQDGAVVERSRLGRQGLQGRSF